MKDESGTIIEWIIPFLFFVAAGWTVWHIPNYLLDFIPPASESLFSQMSALAERKDASPGLPGLFGGFADPIDWLTLIALPILFYFGCKTIRIAPMEFQYWRTVDRPSIFIGRVTMMMILSMTLVMLYEVFLRYAIEAPTLWANELTLWIGGFVFLCAGLYGMQQRSHIRIFLLYDAVPRWVQRIFDVISATLFALFAAFMVFGSYKQVFITKFYKWEMFGTAFDPPIPATIQPMVLIIICLVAIQGIINVISDWNLEEVPHDTDEIDEEEIAAIKRSLGED